MLYVFVRYELRYSRPENDEVISPEPLGSQVLILLDNDFVHPRFRYSRFQPEWNTAFDYFFTGVRFRTAKPKSGLRSEGAFSRVTYETQHNPVPLGRIETESIAVGSAFSRIVARGSSPLPL